MNTPARLSAFAAALALVFGGAWGLGVIVGTPPPPPPPAVATHGGHGEAAPQQAGHSHGSAEVPSEGLVATAAGYTLVAQTAALQAGTPGELAFTITGSDGRPVMAFDVVSEEAMHVAVVRRDGVAFQHLHPKITADGSWRIPMTLPAAGVYRLYADFLPTGGPALVLGTDLFVPGEFGPVAPPESRVAQVAGYQVRLDGDLVPGAPSQVFATVSRNGAAVTDLEPDLGAFGHLVVLRRSDLAYLHVHAGDGSPPAPQARSGPGIPFTVEVPTAGSYRLFLDFRHAGAVQVVDFTVTTRAAS
ncbi:hypothetical protein [Pseudonocardia sp. TRM90224]|uniref:hypothetical protein n=1 Tax=Pseudonocardia sp. TRM90224 TaxID=2812678 RepID=UPI001E42AF54|nr:hypothetical protein [Pseudonocardia sp. TRM90224]